MLKCTKPLNHFLQLKNSTNKYLVGLILDILVQIK